MDNLIPYASWTNDCQGKKDFDGPILSLDTRYWPGPDSGGFMTFDSGTGEIGESPYGPRPSAHAGIHLRLGPREEGDGGGEYLVWAEKQFEGDTEADVKKQVETWAREQMLSIVGKLGGISAFRTWDGKEPNLDRES